MTQSGQGEEPSARPAREGIVLPSDGGEPLLPGMTGAAAGRGAAPAGAPGGQAPPAGGQAWGQPWGPGQNEAPPTQEWGADAGRSWGGPEQPGQAPAPDWGAPGAQPSWGAGPMPTEGAQAYGAAGPAAPQGAQDPRQGAHTLPHAAHSAPLPPAVDEGATQYIPPVTTAPDEGATQYIPPVTAAADEGATQYIPPVGPGALPPETPADDATRFLGRPAHGAGTLPPTADPDAQATQYLPPVPGGPGPAPYGAAPGVPGGDRQTPAEFDNLFRSDAGGAGATQHLPRFDADGAPGAPMGRAAARRADDGRGGDGHGGEGRGGRTRSRVPLIAAVGVGIAVLGIGAGALLSGGNADAKNDDSKNVSATGPAADASQQAGGDPAEAQAVALDKLLADSGNSRGTVIRAVADVKACQNLGQAATDLREAAKQRGGLVTRLSGLAVDRLPGHAELTAALDSAWQASASADTHYAAWADQVAGKKGCPKGHARVTGQAAQGNRASGTASAQKTKAARLWNVIAQKYGLTERQPTQL